MALVGIGLLVLSVLLGACQLLYSRADADEVAVAVNLSFPYAMRQTITDYDASGRFILPTAGQAQVVLAGIDSEYRSQLQVQLIEQDGALTGRAEFSRIPAGKQYELQVIVSDDEGLNLHQASGRLMVQADVVNELKLRLLPHADILPDDHILELSVSGDGHMVHLAAGEYQVYKVYPDGLEGMRFGVMPGGGTTGSDIEETLVVVQQAPDGSHLHATELLDGHEYVYVWLLNEGEIKLDFALVLYETDGPPSAPELVLATVQRDPNLLIESIDLQWTDTSAVESGFAVYRSVDSGEWNQLAASLPADTESFTDELTDLVIESGTTIDYRVAAFNASGSSTPAKSDQLVFRTLMFDANNGIGESPSYIATAGEVLPLPGHIFSRGVYFFDGWSNLAEAEALDYEPDGTFTMPAVDTSLYAFWTAPLLIPDADNQRIVLVRDMSGADMQMITGSKLSDWPEENFYPTDVTIDAQGRIYAAVSTSRNYSLQEIYSELSEYFASMVIRIANASSTTHEKLYPLGEDLLPVIHALAMDPAGEYLYFVDMNEANYSGQLNRLGTSDNALTTLETTEAELYGAPRGLAYAESGGSSYLFVSDQHALHRFDVTVFEGTPAVTSRNLPDITPTTDHILGDIAWLGSALQVIAMPDMYVMDPYSIAPQLHTLNVDMEVQSSIGSKGNPALAGAGSMLFPQRFVGVYKNEDIYVTDGGGYESEGAVDIVNNQDPAHLIRLRHELDVVQEWETYAESEPQFGFEGYNFYIGS